MSLDSSSGDPMWPGENKRSASECQYQLTIRTQLDFEIKIASIRLFKQIDDGQRYEKERDDGPYQADGNGVAKKERIHVVTGFIEFCDHRFGFKPGIHSAFYSLQ